jgi:hypothetical protein
MAWKSESRFLLRDEIDLSGHTGQALYLLVSKVNREGKSIQGTSS